mgnify:CR=1 FL=1
MEVNPNIGQHLIGQEELGYIAIRENSFLLITPDLAGWMFGSMGWLKLVAQTQIYSVDTNSMKQVFIVPCNNISHKVGFQTSHNPACAMTTLFECGVSLNVDQNSAHELHAIIRWG